MKLLLAIPCYNCETQIKRVLEHVLSPDISRNFDYIRVIDNCSKDNTFQVARQFSGNQFFKAEQNKSNIGLGGTFKSAVKLSADLGCEYLVFLHGDDQANIDDVLKLVQKLKKEKGEKTFLGARFMKGSLLFNYNKKRRIVNLFFNLLFSLLLGRRIYDVGSGLNVYHVPTLEKLDVSKYPNHAAFDIYLLLDLIKNKTDFSFFPISWREEDQVTTVIDFEIGLILLGAYWDYLIGKGSRRIS